MFGITQELLETFFIKLLVLLTSFPVHECAHGLVADLLGDDTARKQGRLTLNPMEHLDWTGTIVLFFSGYGWAKPIPVDTRKFKHPRRDLALVSAAGPLSNILLALLGVVLHRVLLGVMPTMRTNYMIASIAEIVNSVVYINAGLAVLNLLPLPPLDGSKIIGMVLPTKINRAMLRHHYQLSIALMVLILFGFLSYPLWFLTDHLLVFLDFVTAPVSMLFR